MVIGTSDFKFCLLLDGKHMKGVNTTHDDKRTSEKKNIIDILLLRLCAFANHHNWQEYISPSLEGHIIFFLRLSWSLAVNQCPLKPNYGPTIVQVSVPVIFVFTEAVFRFFGQNCASNWELICVLNNVTQWPRATHESDVLDPPKYFKCQHYIRLLTQQISIKLGAFIYGAD